MKKTIKNMGLLFVLSGLASASFAGNNEDLIAACKKSDLAAAQKAIDAGADVNFRDAEGWSPIGAAFFSPQITKLLLEKKADPNAGSNPALVTAAGVGSYEVMQLLLKAGADPNKPLEVDPSAGMQKALDAEKAKGKEANKYLVKAYEDQLKSLKGNPVKLYPINRVVSSTLCKECLALLIEKGAKTDMVNAQSKENLLHDYAATAMPPATWITNNQAQVGGWAKMGFTVPEWFSKPDVAKLGTPNEMVQLLVKAGVNINAENIVKQTPTQKVIRRDGDPDVLSAFLNNGANEANQEKSDFQKKIAKVEDVDVDFDFPSEGRNNDNGDGYSANVDLLKPKPKRVGLISFYLYDPASGKSNNGTWTGVATTELWRTPEDVAQRQIDGFYGKGIDALKAAFKEQGMDLLTPAEYLNTDEKKNTYYSFDQETAGFHKEKTSVSSAIDYLHVATVSSIKSSPRGKGYRPFFVSNENPNKCQVGNFVTAGIFGANRKMTSSLGYDLCKALDLDAVVVCYIVTYKEKPNKNNYGVGAVNLFMFGPNPKSEGVDDKNRGQFYCGTRVFYSSPVQFQEQDKPLVSYNGFENVMTAMGRKVNNWVINKKK